jgi:hypothetical protein
MLKRMGVFVFAILFAYAFFQVAESTQQVASAISKSQPRAKPVTFAPFDDVFDISHMAMNLFLQFFAAKTSDTVPKGFAPTAITSFLSEVDPNMTTYKMKICERSKIAICSPASAFHVSLPVAAYDCLSLFWSLT